MAENTQLARLGFRLGVLGSSGDLAWAFPLASGNYAVAAHTDATRTGFYASRIASAEKIGVVVNGYEAFSVGSAASRAVLIGAYTINAAAASLPRTIALPDASGTVVLSGIAQAVSLGTITTTLSTGYATVSAGGVLGSTSTIPWSALSSVPTTFTPAVHASTHGSGGSDPITLAQSQVTGLVADLAAKADSDDVLALAGPQTVTGAKTFSALTALARATVSAAANAATPALSVVATSGGSSDYIVAAWDGAEGTNRRFSVSKSGEVFFVTLSPNAKPTITGSRAGNAALASLLTGLASLGLITDNTTA